MKSDNSKFKLGVVGCGAIGSRIALGTLKELKGRFTVAGLFDIDQEKARQLAKRFKGKGLVAKSVDDIVRRSDVVVEAVNTAATAEIVVKSLKAGKSILVMSVGRLLDNGSLFLLASRAKGSLLLPSGAVAGLDAVKAASLLGIKTITLTSRKPPAGFAQNAYIREKGLVLDGIKKDVVLFDGKVKDAVRFFPQNINVAATVALAAGSKAKLRVRIVAAPGLQRNTHELVLEGAFGRITTTTENTVCPDNPKTSYLAVLSGIKALEGFSSRVKIGT